MNWARQEAELVMFKAVDDLLRKTGLHPRQIDVLGACCRDGGGSSGGGGGRHECLQVRLRVPHRPRCVVARLGPHSGSPAWHSVLPTPSCTPTNLAPRPLTLLQ